MLTTKRTGELRFVGHSGEITDLRRLPAKTMFVADSNLVLRLVTKNELFEELPKSYRNFLLTTRQRARIGWKVRERFIPIDPTFAIMELTKQDLKPDFDAYLVYFNNFFKSVYLLDGYDPLWVRSSYEPAINLIEETVPSIQRTVLKTFALIPPSGKHNNQVILDACDNLLDWVKSEHGNLVLIGGPILLAAIYAIAGSPQAQKLIKVERSKRTDPFAVASNVAWDFMYWIHLDMNYHFKRYDNIVVCTADGALVDLLTQRLNTGPRFGGRAAFVAMEVPSTGTITIPTLARLDDTNLGIQVATRLIDFWKYMDDNSTEDVKFGLNTLRGQIRHDDA